MLDEVQLAAARELAMRSLERETKLSRDVLSVCRWTAIARISGRPIPGDGRDYARRTHLRPDKALQLPSAGRGLMGQRRLTSLRSWGDNGPAVDAELSHEWRDLHRCRDQWVTWKGRHLGVRPHGERRRLAETRSRKTRNRVQFSRPPRDKGSRTWRLIRAESVDCCRRRFFDGV
jgi:hypothetical protein